MSKKLTLLVLCIYTCALSAQTPISGIINHYTTVTDIDYCESILTVSNPVDFQIGQQVLLIQMQGASINESNSSDFGDISTMNSAGLYERTSIINIIGNEIYLQHLLINFYETFGGLQLVSVPTYTDAQVVSPLYPQVWNGETGGVLALEVEGTLTIEAAIDASGRGFRGGVAESINPNNCNWILAENDFFYDLNTWRGAAKGEGIATFISDKEAGKGAQANGGGGANDHNAGGGGGANFTAGGLGGENDEPSTFGCNGFHPGEGGKAIVESTNRFFMGGGGGAGHMNNDVGTDGGNGGGIIFIKTNSIDGSNANLNASGAASLNTAGADGGGGGGAGGVIVLDLNQLNTSLTLNVNGGNGSTVTNGNQERCMGPGGGGSGGVIMTNLSGSSNLTLAMMGGSPGLTTNSTNGCNNSTMGATAGGDGQAILWEELVAGVEEVFATAIINQSFDTTLCEGSAWTLNVEAQGNGLEYQWQVDEGSGFTNLMDGPLYTGTQTNVLTLPATNSDQNNFVFRCVISSNCFADVLSDGATLSVVPAPDVSFDFVIDGTVVSFTNTSQNSGPSLIWIFGDGNISTEPNPVHDYMLDGTYLVSLIVETPCANDTLSQEIIIGNLPTANFSVDNGNGCIPLTVTFTDESLGSVNVWNWDFPGGEPATSDIPNPIVVYNTGGVYDVSLAVTNSVGSNSITYADFINVEPNPEANFSYDANGLTVDFTNLSLLADSYQWSFGDGSDFVFDENPTHSYTIPGVYEVTLIANNEFCGSGITIAIEVMTSSIGDLELEGLEVYPVPMGDRLILDFKKPVGNVMMELFDLKGVLLLQKTLGGGSKFELDVASLSIGLYELRLSRENGVLVRKVVKAGL